MPIDQPNSTSLTDTERQELRVLKAALWEWFQLRAPSPAIALLALWHVAAFILVSMVPNPADRRARTAWLTRMFAMYVRAYEERELSIREH